MSRIYKIILVCHGNICRSPMGEFMLKNLVREAGREGEFVISSAAVSYEEIGNDMYPPAKRKLSEYGIPFSRHSAHRITAKEAAEADLILIMDASNERLIKNIIDSADFHKVHRIMEYAGMAGANVSDPWYTGDFESTYRDLDAACRGLLSQI